MIDLPARTDSELLQDWIDNVRSHDAIEHVGAINRHFKQRIRIVDEFGARSGGAMTALLPLLQHEDADLVFAAALEFRTRDPALFRATMTTLSQVGGTIGAQATRMLDAPPLSPSAPRKVLPADHPGFWPVCNPPPPAMTDRDLVTRLFASLPRAAEQLVRLIVPAIGLWPQPARAEAPIDGSRLGGMPYAPQGWTWPVAATEPMLFIGQINCAEIAGLPGAEQLPSTGLLSFFGDHDTAMGCLLTGQGGAVFYWPDTSGLVAAEPPLEILTVFPRVDLLFRPQWDLPDPESSLLDGILDDAQSREAYRTIHRALRSHGLPEEQQGHPCNRARLLGWPDLLQGEDFLFTLDQSFDQYRLLLQLDSYTDGKDFVDWGPGGFLYYFITRDDFAERQWDNAEFAIQFT
jgi:hypothetical protein